MTPMTDERLEELRQIHFDPRTSLGYNAKSELFAEIDRLRLALRTARIEALKEAAKACEQADYSHPWQEDRPGFDHGQGLMRTKCVEAIDAIIRKDSNEPA